MPYIVIIKSPPRIPIMGSINEPKLNKEGIIVDRDEISGEATAFITRTAVATLDEARTVAYFACDRAKPYEDPFKDEACDLPTEGGTIGPLPDGTVIEVREVLWGDLADQADCYPVPWSHDKILSAFNNK